jgi:isopentenyl diphosphate isomerase/L-lactate dehydrogenase-like FMN-dependent dehydrogenase
VIRRYGDRIANGVAEHEGFAIGEPVWTWRQLEAVGGRVLIALDGGIRCGADVLTALALGADCVLIGRLAAYGLAAVGEKGVLRVLELLHAELRTSIALLGVERTGQLGRSMVQPGPPVDVGFPCP